MLLKSRIDYLYRLSKIIAILLIINTLPLLFCHQRKDKIKKRPAFLYRVNKLKIEKIEETHFKLNFNHNLIEKDLNKVINYPDYLPNREGFYKIVYPEDSIRQFIIFRNDTLLLLSSLAWLSFHGNRDNKQVFSDDILDKAKKSKLSLTCYHIANFTKRILDSLNIEARIVTGFRNSVLNSDNGHTLLEVYFSNKWQVFDLDNNCYFPTKSNSSEGLSFIELCTKLANNQPINIRQLANDLSIDSRSWNESLLAEMEIKLISTQRRIEWYKKVLKVPSIQIGNKNYIIDQPDSTKKNLQKYYKNRLVYLDSLQFYKKFYQDNQWN